MWNWLWSSSARRLFAEFTCIIVCFSLPILAILMTDCHLPHFTVIIFPLLRAFVTSDLIRLWIVENTTNDTLIGVDCRNSSCCQLSKSLLGHSELTKKKLDWAGSIELRGGWGKIHIGVYEKCDIVVTSLRLEFQIAWTSSSLRAVQMMMMMISTLVSRVLFTKFYCLQNGSI